jgi:hypothetical protein
MPDQPRGLYELLITEALHPRLDGLDDRWEAAREPLRAADAPDRIALHLGRVIQRALAAVTDEERVAVATTLARRLVDEIASTIRDVTADEDAPVAPAAVLHAILARLPDGRSETIPEPLIPLLDTATTRLAAVGVEQRLSARQRLVELGLDPDQRLARLVERGVESLHRGRDARLERCGHPVDRCERIVQRDVRCQTTSFLTKYGVGGYQPHHLQGRSSSSARSVSKLVGGFASEPRRA